MNPLTQFQLPKLTQLSRREPSSLPVSSMARWIPLSLTVCAAISLVACGNTDQTELTDWMKTQRAKTPVTIAPVVPPVPFVPVTYSQASGVEPFDELKLKNVLAKLRAAAPTSGIAQPDVSRKRELLESFPLDNIKMTGFILKQGKPAALVNVSGALYSVSAGQYLGQNFGRVTSVSEQEITLREVVQDSGGAWAERISKLPLSVATKENRK
jgi:type IV pilus assembly protein PilP